MATTEPLHEFDDEFETFVEEGIQARKGGDDGKWKLGDLALKIQAKKYSRLSALREFADRVDIPYEELPRNRRVAEVFPENRRHLRLSWWHHQAVIACKDADDLLRQAEQERWNVNRLRQVVRQRAERNKPPRVSDGILSIEEGMQLAIDQIKSLVVDARSFDDAEDVEAQLFRLEERVYEYTGELSDLIYNELWDRRMRSLAPEVRASLKKSRRQLEKSRREGW